MDPYSYSTQLEEGELPYEAPEQDVPAYQPQRRSRKTYSYDSETGPRTQRNSPAYSRSEDLQAPYGYPPKPKVSRGSRKTESAPRRTRKSAPKSGHTARCLRCRVLVPVVHAEIIPAAIGTPARIKGECAYCQKKNQLFYWKGEIKTCFL